MTWRAYTLRGHLEARPFDWHDLADHGLSMSVSDRQHVHICAELGVHPGGVVARHSSDPTGRWYVNQAQADQHLQVIGG